MSNLIVRRDPSQEIMTLREAMDHLFDEAFTRPFGLTTSWQSPAIDLYQTEDEVVVTATLPGIKAEDVQVNITGDMLSLKGEFKEGVKEDRKSYQLRERQYGSFERVLSLPSEVKADQAKAEFENGILTISMPKAESAIPKTVTIKVK